MSLFVNILDQRTRTTIPSGAVTVDGKTYPEGSAQIEQWASVGWRIADESTLAVPEGYVYVSHTWVQDPANPLGAVAQVVTRTQAEQDAIDAANATAAAEAQALWLQGVDVYPRAIEVPVVIVASETSKKGYGILTTDDGTVVTYLDHESPRPSPEVIAQRKMDAINAANARKAQRTNDVAQAQLAKANANAANSVPALKAEVARLAEIIERLCQ